MPGPQALYRKGLQDPAAERRDSACGPAVPDLHFTAALDGYLLSFVLGAGESAATGGAWHPEKLDRVLEEGGSM